MPAFENCPDEVWFCILGHACVDGGRTGVALCVTSWYFNRLSDGLLFQSVAIRHDWRLRAFIKALKDRAPERRIVRHLLIEQLAADTSADIQDDHNLYVIPTAPSKETVGDSEENSRNRLGESDSDGSDWDPFGWGRETEAQHEARERFTRRTYRLQAALQLVSPTLETLFLDTIPLPYTSFYPVQLPFPALQNLTAPAIAYHHLTDVTTTIDGPKLLRLHLLQMSLEPSILVQLLAQASPRLETLRVSLPDTVNELVATLGSFLHIPGYSEAIHDPPGLPSLQNIILALQAIAPPPPDADPFEYCATSEFNRSDEVDELQDLDSATRIAGPRIMFTEEESETRYLRENWLDIINGGDGSWALRLDDEGVRVPTQ